MLIQILCLALPLMSFAQAGNNESSTLEADVGPCLEGDLCGIGFECKQGICVKTNLSRGNGSRSSRRSKRDIGLYCNNGQRAVSHCFPSSYPTCAGVPGPCCGNRGYHCDNINMGTTNVCCPDNSYQNPGGVLVTIQPTPSVPIIPCKPGDPGCNWYTTPQPIYTVYPSQQGFCPSTHSYLGACNVYDYGQCTSQGGECINGQCCRRVTSPTVAPGQGDVCIPHFVPQYGETLLLCPKGKICYNNVCVLGSCQPGAPGPGPGITGSCPTNWREVGACNAYATNTQVCSSSGGQCFNGKCCEPQIYQTVQQQNNNLINCPPAACFNPFPFLRNPGCCKKRK